MTKFSDKEEIWMAYLDGELTAAESAEFEAELTPAQRDRLAEERRFENALGDALTSGAGCPDRLWKRIEQQVADAEGPRRSGAVGSPRWSFPLVAAAAVLLLLGGSLFFLGGESTPDALRMEVSTATAFMAERNPEIGSSESAVSAFLEARSIPVRLQSVRAFNAVHKHEVALLGAGEVAIDGETLPELLFTCCDQPTRVILAQTSSRAAERLENAVGKEDADVLEVRRFGNYVAAVVSKHRSNQVLNLLRAAPLQQASASYNIRGRA